MIIRFVYEIDDSEIDCNDADKMVLLRDMKKQVVCRRCVHWYKNEHQEGATCYLSNDSEWYCADAKLDKL